MVPLQCTCGYQECALDTVVLMCVSRRSQASDACSEWCNGLQSDRQRGSASAALMIAHKPSSLQASVTQPPVSNLCSWKPKHWLICPNLLMLSPQLQTHTHTHTHTTHTDTHTQTHILTVDDSVYQRSCLEIQGCFFVVQIGHSSTKRVPDTKHHSSCATAGT